MKDDRCLEHRKSCQTYDWSTTHVKCAKCGALLRIKRLAQLAGDEPYETEEDCLREMLRDMKADLKRKEES